MTPSTFYFLALISAALAITGCSDKPGAKVVAAASLGSVCSKVTVAKMNWQSAEVLAHIDNINLSKGYGCDVVQVPGDTMPTLTDMMERGQSDVAPEAWINVVRSPWTPRSKVANFTTPPKS